MPLERGRREGGRERDRGEQYRERREGVIIMMITLSMGLGGNGQKIKNDRYSSEPHAFLYKLWITDMVTSHTQELILISDLHINLRLQNSTHSNV